MSERMFKHLPRASPGLYQKKERYDDDDFDPRRAEAPENYGANAGTSGARLGAL